jgi:anhydro-N-acetylmuramic acid kinase
MLNELLADAYFHRPPPKTCGREQWGAAYVERFMLIADKHALSPAERICTASELTVRAIARAIGELTQNPHEVILCGGGARNIYMAMRLRAKLLPASTVAIERFDIDATAKEALSFAMLAAGRIDGVPANVPSATGASRPALLGSITEA